MNINKIEETLVLFFFLSLIKSSLKKIKPTLSFLISVICYYFIFAVLQVQLMLFSFFIFMRALRKEEHRDGREHDRNRNHHSTNRSCHNYSNPKHPL